MAQTIHVRDDGGYEIEDEIYWRGCVQLRQKCDYQRTLLYVHHLVTSNNAYCEAEVVKKVPTGFDYYFRRKQEAKKLLEFISSAVPTRIVHSQKLVTHDTKNNDYDYKHTFCMELVPIIKDCLVCLDKDVARNLGNLGRFVLCLRVATVITLIDPSTLQVREVNSAAYGKNPFEILCQPKKMVEFFVLEMEEDALSKVPVPDQMSVSADDQSIVSAVRPKERNYKLADVWVVRSFEIGQPDAQVFHCRTHLGRILRPGDIVYGYDLVNTNLNDPIFDSMKREDVPDAVLVRKKR